MDQQTRVLNDLDEKLYNISRQKQSWFFHELSWYWRGLDATGYDGQGCNQFTGCVQECRFYPEYGRIEDEEVIEKHNKVVESYRQKNAIVEPPTE